MVKKNIDIYVTLYEKLGNVGKTIVTHVDKLRNGFKTTKKEIDGFSGMVTKVSESFKPFTEAQKRVMKENRELNKLAKTSNFFDVMRMDMPVFKKFNEHSKTFKDKGARMANQIRMITHGLRGFRMEMLGVMFFGMAMQRFFTNLLQPAMEVVGIFDLFKVTLEMLFLPVALLLLDFLMPVMDFFINLPDPVKQAIGIFVLLAVGIGSLLFLFGMLSLGLGSLAIAWGTLTTVVLPILGPIALIALAIAGLILLWANWENVSWKVKLAIAAILLAITALAVFFGAPWIAAVAGVSLAIMGIIALFKDWDKIVKKFINFWDDTFDKMPNSVRVALGIIMPLLEPLVWIIDKIATGLSKLKGEPKGVEYVNPATIPVVGNFPATKGITSDDFPATKGITSDDIANGFSRAIAANPFSFNFNINTADNTVVRSNGGKL